MWLDDESGEAVKTFTSRLFLFHKVFFRLNLYPLPPPPEQIKLEHAQITVSSQKGKKIHTYIQLTYKGLLNKFKGSPVRDNFSNFKDLLKTWRFGSRTARKNHALFAFYSPLIKHICEWFSLKDNLWKTYCDLQDVFQFQSYGSQSSISPLKMAFSSDGNDYEIKIILEDSLRFV